MRKISARYGMYGVAVMLVVFSIEFITFKDKPNWELQEIIGYTTIILSLLFVYFGIRQWRDNYNGGRLTFANGLGLGALISLFPAIAFGLFSWMEMSILDPSFSDKYYAHVIEKTKASTPPQELEATLQQIAAEKEMFSSPMAQFFFMFLTVFIIGLIITIISTLILRRNKAISVH